MSVKIHCNFQEKKVFKRKKNFEMHFYNLLSEKGQYQIKEVVIIMFDVLSVFLPSSRNLNYYLINYFSIISIHNTKIPKIYITQLEIHIKITVLTQ